MKRKFEHPAPPPSELANGPRYWRNLDELAATPGFQAQVEREFPAGADNLEGIDRRQFFRLMAASFALGGVGLAAGCRRPEMHILPYGKSVEGVIPGLPLYFATAMPVRGGAIPLLAETHQGRPTKLEGNGSYGPFGGSTTLMAQAAVLELYDPDRAMVHRVKGTDTKDLKPVTDLLTAIGTKYAATQGQGLAFLAESSTSPSRARILAALKAKLPQAIWAEYEPIHDQPSAAAAQAVFGNANLKPIYKFDQATRILSLDGDFLQEGANALAQARDFAKGRRVAQVTDPMNRLYVVESGFTITGSMADHRLRLASSHMVAFAAALASKVTGDTAYDAFSQGLDLANKDTGKWLEECAKDLKANGGKSLVVAGAHLPAQVHGIAYLLNVALGNVGQTVDFVAVDPVAAASIGDLTKAAAAGSVSTLFILGGNPAYNAPADLDFAATVKAKVPEIVRVGYFHDETSNLTDTHLASAHFLESWGDARTADGTIVPIQPQIIPLFNGLTDIEILAWIAGETFPDPTAIPYGIVRETFRLRTSGDLEKNFRQFLHDGLLADSKWPVAPVGATAAPAAVLAGAPAAVALSKDSLEVRFINDLKVDDGRFANNGWLQECPHPITKQAWDNVISISPRLAKAMGIDPKGGIMQVSRIELGESERGREFAFIGEVTMPDGRKVKGPLHIQPGLSNWTILLPLGYGRTASGHIGTNTGRDFYAARNGDSPDIVAGATLALSALSPSDNHYFPDSAGKRYEIGTSQEHWSMEGRDLARESNYDDYLKHPDYVKEVSLEEHSPSILGQLGESMTPGQQVSEIPRGNSIYSTPKFTGVHQWGMSIDLNTCIGCNACVVACQSENNIPIVGRQQVLAGRSMHWIRIDRYYTDGQAASSAFGGDANREIPEDPQAIVQPLNCQQCELAPCEMVCPVAATVHDPEGINVMAYNRCIGTRYCANNCPYKVRRFNYFDFNKRQTDSLYLGPLGPSGMPELAKLAKNPEVTVRMRGVMEKCTYCIQRIKNAEIQQKAKAGASDAVQVPDGTIKTACMQVCPVHAIEFGNLLDPDSAVSKAKARSQDYALLGYLNTRPRTTYLGKLRNPNPAMPDYVSLPFSRQEFNSKNEPAGAGPEKKAEGGSAALDAAKLMGGLS